MIKSLIAIVFICFGVVSEQRTIPSVKSIKLYSCETGFIYELNSNEIIMQGTWAHLDENSKTFVRTRIDKEDLNIFQRLVGDLMIKKEDEILYNPCVDDGFNFKVYLLDEKIIKKKLFIGNYYDDRIDSLTRLFDKYIVRHPLGSPAYRVGYIINDAEIQQLIKRQKDCKTQITAEQKASLLNKWCGIDSLP